MDSLACIVNQNDRLHLLFVELFEWMKSQFSPPSSTCPACLSRYGTQTMHVPTTDCEIHVDKRRVIHIRDLVLADGEYLMDTQEALSKVGFSRGTLNAHREQGNLTDVRIGKKNGGVRFISTEVMKVRELYSVPKGKV